jgi:hypothetical protein
MLTAAEGLERILVECLSAQARAPAPERDVAVARADAPINYTDLELAVLRLRWIGEELSNRGGVGLMRATLYRAIQDQAAAPWMRSLADVHWRGIGCWSARPAPMRGPMG